MKKKILLSVMTIALVGALIGVGVHAYFSDIETSTGNVFAAGTLNLMVGAADPCEANISMSDMKPGDSGIATGYDPTGTEHDAIWLVQNTGSISGNLSINLSAITNNENMRSEVEENAGDNTPGTTEGELGSLLKVAFWMDADKDNTWSSGDYYLNSTGAKVVYESGTTLPDAAYDILNNYGGKSWSTVQTVAAESDAGNFRVEYNFPEGGSGDNVAQSDSCEFTITFELRQA